MDVLNEILSNVNYIEVIIFLVTTGFAIVKGTDFYKDHLSKKQQIAVESIMAAVEEVYENKVRHDKKEKGKLSDNEREDARETATSLAVDIAQREGVNLRKTLTTPSIRNTIEKAVAKNKARRKAAKQGRYID